MTWNKVIPSAEAVAGFIKAVFYHVGLIAIGMIIAAFFFKDDFIRGFDYALKHGQIERVVVK